ncbi:MAG: XRE family transcriptional regulator [Balneolales bacterium]
MSSTRPHINPQILTWARERVNYDPVQLAGKVPVPVNRYQQWERGEERPTHRQLYKLAKVLGRSPGIFHLRQPPEEPQPRLEMRRVYGVAPEEDSPAFSLDVQRIMNRRDIVLDLLEVLDEHAPEILVSASLQDNPEQIARAVREWLGVSTEDQINWENEGVALKAWRNILERKGILSFQMQAIPIDQVRGFALNYRPMPVIAFNSNDSVNGRIFTLFHEAGHILLGESVLHKQFLWQERDQHEFWCNRFSAAFLLPRDALLSHPILREKGEQAEWMIREVKTLSRLYKVSAAVMIRRLQTLNRINTSSYNTIQEEIDRYQPPESSGGGNFYNTQLARLGTFLPTLAFEGYYSGEISTRDLAVIMGTKVGNLGRFEEKVMGSTYAFR